MLHGILTSLGLMNSVNSGDFVYHLSNGAYTIKQFLPDVVEPVVLPVLDMIADHPVVVGTAAIGVGLFWHYQKSHGEVHAEAGTFRMNCGLHSIIHTWLSQDLATIRSQIHQHVIFQEIIRTCLEHYEIPLENSVNTFLALCHRFRHPLDREVLLGQVFRRVLRNYVPYDQLNTINDDEYIYEDLLQCLTSNMGAKLTIHNKAFASIQGDTQFLPHDGEYTWEINLYHVGEHYDFKLPTPEQCRAHNARMNSPRTAILDPIKEDVDAVKEAVRGALIPSRRPVV